MGAKQAVAIAWLKTITNAWCTTHRMHEDSRLNCIFGCRTSPDRIDHYLVCPILWSILDEGFGGNLTPCIFSRLNFSAPCERKLHIIAAAFEIYHALKISLRSVVDVANTTHIFAPIIAHARTLARDHGSSFRHNAPADSETSETDSLPLTPRGSHD